MNTIDYQYVFSDCLINVPPSRRASNLYLWSNFTADIIVTIHNCRQSMLFTFIQNANNTVVGIVTNVITEAELFYIYDNSDNYKCKKFLENLVGYIMLKKIMADNHEYRLSAC